MVHATPANLRRVEAVVQRISDEPVGSDAWLARSLVIPKLDFHDVTLQQALKIIQQESRAADPGKKGVKVVLAPGCQTNRQLTFSVANASVLEALFYAAKLTGHHVQIGKQGVVLQPAVKE